MQKSLHLGHFRPFLPKIGPMRIFWENQAPSVLALTKSYIQAKNLKKTNEPILRKSVNGQTDRQTVQP